MRRRCAVASTHSSGSVIASVPPRRSIGSRRPWMGPVVAAKPSTSSWWRLIWPEARDRRATLQAMVDAIDADASRADLAARAAATPVADAVQRAKARLAGPVGPEAPPPPPPFDPAAAMAAVEDAAATGEAEATREAALAAARGFRGAGQLHAAIDACYQALATSPADPALHVTLADLYVDRGWRVIAADKLVLLASLVDLADDPATKERLCQVAARVPDDPASRPSAPDLRPTGTVRGARCYTRNTMSDLFGSILEQVAWTTIVDIAITSS